MAESRVRATMDRLAAMNPFRGQTDLPDVPRVRGPNLTRKTPVGMTIAAAQRTISQLQYNFLPTTFFPLQKNRPLRNLLNVAEDIIAESLPIRCLEASFLAVYLTQNAHELDRFPLAFKSVCRGESYRHIVTVVRSGGRYGAIGLSRVASLMDKPMEYPSLIDLLDEYARAYASHGHELTSVKLGLCFSHDSDCRLVPMWRCISTPVPRLAVATPSADTAAAAPSETGDHRGVSSPMVDQGSPPVSRITSFRQDAKFAALIDNFTALLSELSDQYDRGMGEFNAVTSQQQLQQLPKARVTASPSAGAGTPVVGVVSPAALPAAASSPVDAMRLPLPSPQSATHDTSLDASLDAAVQIDGDAASPTTTTGAVLEEDPSDTEENAHRVACIRQGRSPFVRVRASAQATGGGGDAAGGGARRRSTSVAAPTRTAVTAPMPASKPRR